VRRRRALAASLVPASLLALALAGCGDLLGLKDLELYPPEAGADANEDSALDGTGGDTGVITGDSAGTDSTETMDGKANDGPTGSDSSAHDASEETAADGPAPPTDSSTPVDSSTPIDSSTPPMDSSMGTDGPCSTNFQTDRHNCGSCGHDCLGGLCSGGLCEAFAIATSVTAYDIAASAGTLYWVDQASTVWTCTIASNACAARSFATGQSTPVRITLGGTGNGTVFWSNYGSGGAADGSIMTLPLAGGTPATLESGLWTPQGVAADDTYAFWAETYAPTPVVVRRTLGNSTVMNIPGTNAAPTAVAVGGGTVYWSDSPMASPGSVEMAPEGSLAEMPVQGTQTTPYAISADSTYVYWVDYATAGAVWQYTVSNGGKQQIGTTDVSPIDIASDAAYAYWVDQGTTSGFNGKVVQWNASAAASTDRAMGLDQPTAIAIDANAIYFSTLGDNTLHMMVR